MAAGTVSVTRSLVERTIMARVVQYLKAQGFFVFKLHGSPMQRAGLPDLLAIRAGRAAWFEVKRPGQKVTRLQEYMLVELREAGCTAAVVEDVRGVERIVSGRQFV